MMVVSGCMPAWTFGKDSLTDENRRCDGGGGDRLRQAGRVGCVFSPFLNVTI